MAVMGDDEVALTAGVDEVDLGLLPLDRCAVRLIVPCAFLFRLDVEV